MLYVSLFLIAIGFIILGYSIYMTYASTPAGKTPVAQPPSASAQAEVPPPVQAPRPAGTAGSDLAVHPLVSPRAEESASPAAAVSLETGVAATPATETPGGAVSSAAPLSGITADVPVQTAGTPYAAPPAPQAAAPAEGDHWAILYDDASGMIDYTGAMGKINPQPESYRNLKRIGRGKLVCEKEGISFYVDNKVFRYDFHRIRDVKTGDMHLAVFIGGQESVKLFVFEGPDTIIARIGEEYKTTARNVRQV